MPISILITGAKGILGRRLCEELRDIADLEIIHFAGDVNNLADVEANFKHRNISSVIHLAAIVAVDDVEASPQKAFSTNVGGTINIMSACVEYGVGHVIYCSSSHVYAPKDTDIDEESAIDPTTTYGLTKLYGEKLAREVLAHTNIKLCIARVFSLFDVQQKRPYLYPSLRERIQQHDFRSQFEVYNGASVRDFSSSAELACMFKYLLLYEAEGIFNLGSGLGISVSEFARKIAYDEFGKSLITVDKGGTDRVVANISKISELMK